MHFITNSKLCLYHLGENVLFPSKIVVFTLVLVYYIGDKSVKTLGANILDNFKRQIVKIIEEISAESGYSFSCFADGFALEISNGKNTTRVFGYQFDNPTSSREIATDKCACFELLSKKGIPAVPHFLILPPEKEKYVACPIKASDLVAKYPQLVAKPCKGTSGSNVIRFSGMDGYKRAEAEILPFSRDIALSPFLPLDREFRCVVLGKNTQLIYEKIRTSGWKHNLSGGAVPVTCKLSENLQLCKLAEKTATALNLDFCAVDIATCEGEYLVIEVNSGIMFERFSRFSDENYQTAKNIYKKALKHFLKEENRE